MLKEFGVQFVILGHSERRQFYGESDNTVALRARAAVDHGLRACVCVGEQKEQFEAGETKAVVLAQLRHSLSLLTPADLHRLVVCYEPVWAIGTGLAATPEQAAVVHGEIRGELRNIFRTDAADQVRILYGGSTTPANIAGFTAVPDIHGAIVGGASLDPEKFAMLIENGLRGKQ
jgi:triosephosphate isomerase